MKHRVVVIGTDVRLVESRAMVLRSRNYNTACGPESEASHLLESHPAILLLCSSLSAESAEELTRRGRLQSPGIRIVRLEADHEPGSPITDADAVVKVDYTPMTWISVIDRLLSSEDQQHARQAV